MPVTPLNIIDFIKIIYRSLFIQASWNSERMQGLGYCFCLIPFAKKYLENKEQRVQFLNRNLVFFNTHPYMVNWIIGVSIKLEQQSFQEQNIEAKQIDRFKQRMSGVVAAIGDKMFWSQIRPISAMIGFLLTLYFQLIGLVVFFVLYNLPHLYVRIKGLLSGYQKGPGLMNSHVLKNYKSIIIFLNKVGGLLIGILLILIANSKYMNNKIDLVAFSCGIVLMYFFIKMKISIPTGLVVLVFLSSAIGALM